MLSFEANQKRDTKVRKKKSKGENQGREDGIQGEKQADAGNCKSCVYLLLQ